MLMVWLEYSHVQADDHQNSIDKRLEKLEHMMEALIAKLDDVSRVFLQSNSNLADFYFFLLDLVII